MAAPLVLGKMLSRFLAAGLVDAVGGELRQLGIRLDAELTLPKKREFMRGFSKAVTIAMNRAAKPVRTRVISEAGRIARFGFTQKSIGTKLSKWKAADRVLAIIGPKMSFSRNRGKRKSGPNAGKPIKHVPWRYARFLVRGTRYARPRDYLSPAYEAEGPGFEKRLTREIARELAKLLRT